MRDIVCIDDDQRMPVPVGTPCAYCGQAIVATDQGLERLALTERAPRPMLLVHINCLVGQITNGAGAQTIGPGDIL